MNRFEAMPLMTDAEVKQSLNQCIVKIHRNLEKFTKKFPSASSEGNFYQEIENVDWTNGFWTGEIWLAYEYTKNKEFLNAASIQVESFDQRIKNKVSVDHHDMGFLYSLSCVAAYKLVGSESGKESALLAANQLCARFQEKGQFIQAWGDMDDRKNYRLIIDCLLNVPLLFWATDITQNQSYSAIANSHIETCLKYIVRQDNSTFHTFFFEPESGNPLYGETCQGYSNESIWARGQAWGIYGIALAYRYTKKLEYINLFHKVAGLYISKLPEDMIPFWDLIFTDGDNEPRDSSSAAIVVCGFLEMAKYLEEEEANYYINLAKKIMKSLASTYEVKDVNDSNGLLLHGTYSKKSPFNTCTPCGVDECVIWGDYFYMEALMRLNKEWNLYW